MTGSPIVRWFLAIVGVVLLWNVMTAKPWRERLSAQGPSGVFTVGERLEIRAAGGLGVKECTIARVANSWIQCREQPLEWWNTEQVIQVIRTANR